MEMTEKVRTITDPDDIKSELEAHTHIESTSTKRTYAHILIKIQINEHATETVGKEGAVGYLGRPKDKQEGYRFEYSAADDGGEYWIDFTANAVKSIEIESFDSMYSKLTLFLKS